MYLPAWLTRALWERSKQLDKNYTEKQENGRSRKTGKRRNNEISKKLHASRKQDAKKGIGANFEFRFNMNLYEKSYEKMSVYTLS